MKKIFTLCFAAALSATVYAQELKVLHTGSEIPEPEDPQLYGEAISANGRYVCGAVDFGEGVFIADAFSGEVKYSYPETTDDGSELRCVDNSGIAIGYAFDGITYSFATEQIVDLEGPENTRGILGEALSNDGSVKVGSILASETLAGYSKDDGAWNALPFPPKEEMELLFKKVPQTSAAKRVSGDGNVILGFIGNFEIPCLWIKNDKGEYVPDLFPVRYLKLSADDLNNDERPLSGVSAHFLCLSNNGRYVCMLGLMPKDGEDYMKVPVLYDVENKTLKVFSEYQEVDPSDSGLYPSAVADDGTFIGSVGQHIFFSHGSFIMKAGDTQAELFVDAFPVYYERYGVNDCDLFGFAVPTGISANGRYIVGYAYYSDDYNDMYSPVYYETYVLDRGEGASVDQISSPGNTPEGIFSIDGRSLREMTKGINIVRNSDGSVRKIFKK